MSDTKQMTRKDWSNYYADPQNYGKVFADYSRIVDLQKERGLSSSEYARKLELEFLIREDLSDLTKFDETDFDGKLNYG